VRFANRCTDDIAVSVRDDDSHDVPVVVGVLDHQVLPGARDEDVALRLSQPSSLAAPRTSAADVMMLPGDAE
jgi:hypothetical protein